MTALATAHGADRLGDQAALTDGFQAAFIGAAVIAGAGALAALAWLRGPRASASTPERPAEAPAAVGELG